MYRYLLLIWFLLGFVVCASAQKPDTATVKSKHDQLMRQQDSLSSKPFVPKAKPKKDKVYNPDSTHSPHKAVMRSLMIPGWGQVYNHRWWKVPVIYTGMGLLVSGIVFNQNNYNILIKEAQLREKGITEGRNPELTNVQDADIIAASDAYRRNRDLCILGLAAAWGIQVIDAYIDAKFKHSYTMDNDLSFKVAPTFINPPMYASNSFGSYIIPGLKITFALK